MNNVVLIDMQRRSHVHLSREAANRSAQLAAVRNGRQAGTPVTRVAPRRTRLLINTNSAVLRRSSPASV
jgi:hypothetical protein